jgi:hypothetical protein
MEPGDGAVDDPPVHSESGAVRDTAAGDHRLDAQGPYKSAVLVVVLATVTEDHVGPSTRPSDQARDGRNLGEEGQQLGDVGGFRRSATLRAGCPVRQRGRGACCPDLHGRRGWLRFWAPSSGPDVAGVDHRPGPADARTSCRSRNRAPGAGTPTGCRCAGRTEFRTEPAGQEPAAGPASSFGPGSGNNGSISDHSSSDTIHGREFLFPTVSSFC